jgi:hypothetical protein
MAVCSQVQYLPFAQTVIERFPQPLREDLGIGIIQSQEPIIMRNIDLGTFALYYEYIYIGNYVILETVLTLQNSSQVTLQLKGVNA